MSSCTHCCESSEDRSGLLTDKYKEGIDLWIDDAAVEKESGNTSRDFYLCNYGLHVFAKSRPDLIRDPCGPESSVQLSSAEGADQGLSLSLALPNKARILCIDSL